MRDLELGRLIRVLRHRRGWRQEDCAERAQVHRSTWSMLERGKLAGLSVMRLRDCLSALEMRLDLVPSWRGADMGRLLDQHHAGMATAWTRILDRWGWEVLAESSFNHYGDRGRVDLLAWFAPRKVLLVVEIKTEVANIQELLGGIDVKARLGPMLAQRAGWGRPSAVVPVLIVSDTTTNRRRIQRVEPLFRRFDLRGKAAISWLRRPGLGPGPGQEPAPGSGPTGLLIFSVLSSANLSRVRRVRGTGEHVRSPGSSVATGPGAPRGRPDPA